MVPVNIFQTQQDARIDNRINGVAVSGTTTYYSRVWSSRGGHAASIVLQWTGTPTGTLTLWFSDKEAPSEADDSDWIQDTTYAPSNPAGAAGKTGDNWTGAAGRRWRLRYVNASGSGVLTGNVHVAAA